VVLEARKRGWLERETIESCVCGRVWNGGRGGGCTVGLKKRHENAKLEKATAKQQQQNRNRNANRENTRV
jgi:hypothetical protein